MWFFTSEGFYSAVEETKLKRHLGQISVRAREPGALELLRERYMPGLSETSVTPSSVSADYRYRAWIDRDDFAAGLAEVGRQVDYSNFKSEAAHVRGYGSFEKALHKVWDVMGRLQPGGPYGYGGAGYPPIPEGEPKPKPYVPKGGGKKKRSKQAKLPLSFSSAAGSCEDCGHELDDRSGGWFGGRWLCKSVSDCMDRSRATH